MHSHVFPEGELQSAYMAADISAAARQELTAEGWQRWFEQIVPQMLLATQALVRVRRHIGPDQDTMDLETLFLALDVCSTIFGVPKWIDTASGCKHSADHVECWETVV